MLDWFTSGQEQESAGLQKLRSEFGQMLDAGRHVFDTAANAFLGGTDLEVIRKDLFSTDKRINKAERQIRRALVVHASIHGASEFPACLVLMSIVKDAERIGDYAKNLFDLAELAPGQPQGEHLEQLVELKDDISHIMATCREIFDADEEEQAKELIRETDRVENRCDEEVRKLIQQGAQDSMNTTYVLAYRYFKRVASHARNVASSIVQPLHKLDFTSKIVKEGQEEPKTEE
ncbi:MAG: PhoU domain-containing protein [Planctomycetota bacterium]|nr:PhoU domain-containing protein [Planctomycetota bacterium]